MKKINLTIKVCIILIAIFGINKIDVKKDSKTIFNDNSNKVLDLTAMAVKIEEIKMKDLYYPKDTYVGYLTAYVAFCPLCSGYLGCNGQNVLDGTTSYNDKEYGSVKIMASSKNLACGSIVSYDLNGEEIVGIVLDRGVLGTNLDLLVQTEDTAYNVGKRYITYDVLRFGWNKDKK